MQLPAIMASERQRGGTYLDTFELFEDRRRRLGIAHLPLVLPMAYFGVCYWDHSVFADDEAEALEQRIHQVLHPNIPFKYSDYCAANAIEPDEKSIDRQWRNAKCDVQVAWSHIRSCADVLVTADGNFTKLTKRDQLIALGVGDVRETESAFEAPLLRHLGTGAS